ncbi:MAG: Trm112 family protein [Pseudomonadota bacterium]
MTGTGPEGRPLEELQADNDTETAAPRAVERAILEFLVCPIRKTTLIYDANVGELISPAADVAYPIRDGVPLLTEECARPLTDEDRHRHRIR